GARARAGRRPTTVRGRLPGRPPDPRPIAGHGAMAILERLVRSPDAVLIDEWAALAVSRGLRVGESTVPALLDWWSRQSHRSEAVFQSLGTGGAWLASLNEAWKKPVIGGEVPANA